MRIFLSAGEASGDAYAAAFVRELRVLREGLTYEGIGGPRLAAEGAALHADTSRWGAISITQGVKTYPRVVVGYYRAKRRLSSGTPGLFVPVDFGFVNIKLANHAKNRGWKVLYFVPPGSWRRDRQGRDLPRITDAISTPFPWSAEMLREMGANAHWFGHPIKQLLREQARAAEDRLAVLPGSREHEISENLPVIAQALQGFAGTAEFALAPGTDAGAFEGRWRDLSGRRDDRFALGDTGGVLRRARAAVVCSGTATLEAALCRVPMVVMYRVTKTMVVEAKIIGFKPPKYIGLPNILLDRDVVPELIQDAASPSALRSWIDRLWEDTDARRVQLRDFDELDTLLGPSDAISKTAGLALSLLPPLG